jgi:hypothetical protein
MTTCYGAVLEIPVAPKPVLSSVVATVLEYTRPVRAAITASKSAGTLLTTDTNLSKKHRMRNSA